MTYTPYAKMAFISFAFKLLKITNLVVELKKSKENSILNEASRAKFNAAKEYH